MTQERILSDPSPAELAAAVEENLFAFFRTMATLPESEIEESETLSRHLAFPSNPMYKGVWRTRLSSNQADIAIDESIAWFKSHNAPFFFWWTGPSTAPDDLGQRLAAHGLISMAEQAQHLAPNMKFMEQGSPGMVADLNRMNENVLTQVPPDLTIEEVRDEASLNDFKRTLIEGYEMPETMAQGWVQASLRFGVGRTPWQLYLGRLGREVVATNIVFAGAGVVGVYGITTIRSARGKGIGGAITLKPLLDARAKGYQHAVLFSTEIGIHAYERIGFRKCGVWINRYLWRNG